MIRHVVQLVFVLIVGLKNIEFNYCVNFLHQN